MIQWLKKLFGQVEDVRDFVADFETTKEDTQTRVWGYGIAEVGNHDFFEYGNNLDDFMAWCEGHKSPVNVYFHNLKFDGEFIIYWLLTHGFTHSDEKQDNTFNVTISAQGQFYMIEVIYKKLKKRYHKTVFYDSLKKLPFPVKTIAKAFNLEIRKGNIDYELERPVGHKLTGDELAYIENDVKIIAQALTIQFEQELTRMTIGSDALFNFKESIGGKKVFESNFPVVPLVVDQDIRQAYKGGFTYVNGRYRGKDIGRGVVLDVNSMYPWAMYYQPLPYGTPIHFVGKYEKDEMYPLYIQKLRCTFVLKNDHLPTIQIKNNLSFVPTEYLHNNGDEPVELILTNVDLALFFDHYHVDVEEWQGGWKFKECKGVFKDYIDYWMEVKENNTGALRQLAKLMLNSLYGKFATNPDVTGKYPVLENDHVAYKLKEQEFRDPVYTPMGCFITAWARHNIITTAQSVYHRFIYADTDSIHLEGTDIPDIDIHPTKLGYWDHEGTFTRARFLRQKTYIEEYDNVLQIKCAGMPDAVKEKVNWDNFQMGWSENGKLRPKHVSGGVILEDSYFTIK